MNHKIFETNSSFHTLQENSIFLLQEIFTSTEKTLISGEGLSTRQLFYELLRFS